MTRSAGVVPGTPVADGAVLLLGLAFRRFIRPPGLPEWE